MGEMPMPNGGTMSMVWMRAPSQTWLGAAASFLAMWIVMMAVMMLPSLVPMLTRYRDAVGRLCAMRLGRLTALVGAGYFFIWIVIGAVVHALDIALAAIQMWHPALARLAPIATGAIVLIAGAVQLSAWKARRLARCRESLACDGALPPTTRSAWRHGLRLGLDCAQSCAGPMAVALGFGVMDLRAMLAVSAVITAERLAPAGERVARVSGMVAAAVGLMLLVRAPSPHSEVLREHRADHADRIGQEIARVEAASQHQATNERSSRRVQRRRVIELAELHREADHQRARATQR
jgi:predicted metal-binding membrane protein